MTLPVNSQVIQQGGNSRIEAGTIRGSNLLHSFEQFSVPAGGKAYFNNASGIQNVFSRVTGGVVSNIDGILQANGTANLFLLNPSGIIFGPNAKLDIGGSFLSTTADSINFSDGTQFSATSPRTTPLLVVNVPVGLNFEGNTGAIRIQGSGQSSTRSRPIVSPITRSANTTGLQVQPGRTLAIIGGDVTLEGGSLTAEGGRIELASVGTGIVNINPITAGWLLGYESVQSRRDIDLFQRSAVDASGINSGFINILASNLVITNGSLLLIQNQGALPGGRLSVNASESVRIAAPSPEGLAPTGIVSETLGDGKGAEVEISTKNIIAQDGTEVSTRTYSAANGGDLTLNASNSIQVVGFSSVDSRIFSLIATGTFSFGQAGKLAVNARQLTLRDGGNLGSASLGDGNSGNLVINAADITLSGIAPAPQPSALFSSTGSAGDAGIVKIQTSRLKISDRGVISSSTAASGNAGGININASEFIEVAGLPPNTLRDRITGIISVSSPETTSFLQNTFGVPLIPSGNSGSVVINTPQLTVKGIGEVSVASGGPGRAGTLQINAKSVLLDNFAGLGTRSTTGQNGNVFLKTESLQLRNNSLIGARSFNLRDAQPDTRSSGGNITIDTDLLAVLENSSISANAQQGLGGQVTIKTNGLLLSPDSAITATSDRGPQFNGVVEINTPEIDLSRTAAQPAEKPQTPQVSTVCQSRAGSSGSSLVNTGTGGTPASAKDPLSSSIGWYDSSIPQTENSAEESEQLSARPRQIIEAQGWRKNDDGTMSMVVEADGVTPYSSLQTPPCKSKNSKL